MRSLLPFARQRVWKSMAMISPQALKLPLPPSSPSPKLSLFRPLRPQLNGKNRAFQSTKLVSRDTLAARTRVVAGASASGFSPDISEKLGDVRIFTAAGEPVLFKDLWDQKEVNDVSLHLYPNFWSNYMVMINSFFNINFARFLSGRCGGCSIETLWMFLLVSLLVPRIFARYVVCLGFSDGLCLIHLLVKVGNLLHLWKK